MLIAAVRAAIEAGNAIMDVYSNPNADFQIELKADNTPLTIADRRANELITKALSATPFPVLSEEGKLTPYEERRQWKALWIVDPLDGTKEFIKKNGEFTVNIAFVVNGNPVLGVIYVPASGVLYFADTRVGAFKIARVTGADSWPHLLAQAVRLPFPEPHDGYVVVASRSHLSPETEQYIRGIQRSRDNVSTVAKGSSLKLCLIAEGVADVYPRFSPTMEWDIAAGHAIVRAAGKNVYRMDNHKPLVYNKENLVNPWFISQ